MTVRIFTGSSESEIAVFAHALENMAKKTGNRPEIAKI